MSRKNRFIEKLTAAQKSALEKGYRHGRSHITRRKCQSILLSHSGKTVKELQDFFAVSGNTIYSWFNQWESEGIKGLELKPGRGRRPKLDIQNEQQVQKIKTLVENEPQNLNRVVGQIKSEMSVDLSKKTLQRFLKNLNMPGNALDDGSKGNQMLKFMSKRNKN